MGQNNAASQAGLNILVTDNQNDKFDRWGASEGDSDDVEVASHTANGEEHPAGGDYGSAGSGRE